MNLVRISYRLRAHQDKLPNHMPHKRGDKRRRPILYIEQKGNNDADTCEETGDEIVPRLVVFVKNWAFHSVYRILLNVQPHFQDWFYNASRCVTL